MVGGVDERAPPTSVTRVLVVSCVLSLLLVLSLFRGCFSGFSGFLPSTKTSRLKGLPCLNIDYSITSLCSRSTVFYALFARMYVPTSRTIYTRLTTFNSNFHCFIASCFSFFLLQRNHNRSRLSFVVLCKSCISFTFPLLPRTVLHEDGTQDSEITLVVFH